MEVVIVQTFDRYPEAGGAPEQFLEGFTVTVSREDAEAWIAKGLARAAGPAPAPVTHD